MTILSNLLLELRFWLFGKWSQGIGVNCIAMHNYQVSISPGNNKPFIIVALLKVNLKVLFANDSQIFSIESVSDGDFGCTHGCKSALSLLSILLVACWWCSRWEKFYNNKWHAVPDRGKYAGIFLRFRDCGIIVCSSSWPAKYTVQHATVEKTLMSNSVICLYTTKIIDARSRGPYYIRLYTQGCKVCWNLNSEKRTPKSWAFSSNSNSIWALLMHHKCGFNWINKSNFAKIYQ